MHACNLELLSFKIVSIIFVYFSIIDIYKHIHTHVNTNTNANIHMYTQIQTQNTDTQKTHTYTQNITFIKNIFDYSSTLI